MAKRYSVVRPSIGGSPGFIPAGGGKARAGRIPKAAEASFSIDLNLAGLRKTRDHQKRVKTLEESGLYEGIDLNLIDPDKVAQLYTKLPSDLAALAKSQREQEGLRARGSYFQDQADLGSEPPRHFIGSEYERVKGNLDSPAAQELSLESMVEKPTLKDDFDISDYGPGEYDAINKDMIREDPFWDFSFTPSDSKKPPESDLGPVPEKNLTRVEEDLANFLGIDPSFVTKDMYTSRTQFQKELEKPEKVVDPLKDAKEISKINKEGETVVSYYDKGTGELKSSFNVGVVDYTKGERMFSFSGFDDKGKPQVTAMVLGPDLEVRKATIFDKGTGRGTGTMPEQARLLATFLMQRAIEDPVTNPTGKGFDKMTEAEQAKITDLVDVAQNPAAYLLSPEGKKVFLEFSEFLREKGKLDAIVDLMKEINKMGANEGGQEGINPITKKPFKTR